MSTPSSSSSSTTTPPPPPPPSEHEQGRSKGGHPQHHHHHHHHQHHNHPSGPLPLSEQRGQEHTQETLESPTTRSSEETTAIIPGLPDHLTSTSILPLLPISLLPSLSSTSRSWLHSFRSSTTTTTTTTNQLLCIFPGDPHLPPRPHLVDPTTLLWLPLPSLRPDPHSHSLSLFRPLSSVGPTPLLLLLGGSRFDARSFPLDLPSPSPSSFLLPLSPLTGFNRGGRGWAPLPDMPTPRAAFACAPTPDGHRVLVAGGGSAHALFPCGGTRTAAAEALDVASGEWRPLPPLRRPRAGCIGWVMRNEEDGEEEFWVVGGYAGYRAVSGVLPRDVYCRDGEVLGLTSGQWRAVGDMWEEGERGKLGKVAVMERGNGDRSADAVFMLDNNRIFSSLSREGLVECSTTTPNGGSLAQTGANMRMRYNVPANRWFKETTLRRKLASDELCGFVAMNGELYVLTSLLPCHLPDQRRSQKRKATLDMQIYDPKKRKWRFVTTHTPFRKPLDFRIAVLCAVQLQIPFCT